MALGIKTEIILRLNELAGFAKKGDDFFGDELCNFLSNEFDLEAAVIFSVNQENSLTVIGKSANARRNFLSGSSFNCNVCKLIQNEIEHNLHFDSNCNLQISDSLIYEGCVLTKTVDSLNLLFKLAKKTAFTKAEKDSLQKIVEFVSLLFSSWLGKKGNVTAPSSAFSKIVADSTFELKNNANSIIGFTTILTEESLSPSVTEYLSSIKKNAQSLLLNINDLNELAKADANSLTGITKKISVTNTINEILNLFAGKLSARNVTFKTEYAPALSRQIELDDQKLRYIITNLLLFTATSADEGEVVINAVPAPEKKIKTTISFKGKNLPDEILNKIFEPYTLAKLNEYKNTSFSGLGLTLVKKYVNYLGGDITAGNTVGGTTFAFTINGEVMSDLETTISQLPKPTSKNKVLVIEDDYATSKLLSNYLNKWGYNPTIVSKEDQAMSIINNDHLLAVILDIEIPNTNGLELLKKIHEHPNTKNVPVIVCSIEPEQQKAFMMGAVEYFVKPINYNYLVEVLTSYKLRKDSNILCVDDDLPTLNLVKQAIELAGFNPIAENVSANVMNMIIDKQIDLAIVDLDMPHPNGFELIKLIKSEKRFAHLPIIIYTGKENYKEDLHKIEGLFEELLDKRSTNIEDLADTINAMINRYDVPPPVEEVILKKGGIKILLAEDYKHSQIIVTRLLKKNNFEDIVVVENGEDAVKMAQQEKFDLILMDMQMPIMNGFEATEKIRQMPEYKSTPVIALTAFAMKGDREKCLEAGATDYIPKPIDSKEFIEKVKYYTNA
ncbi:MAG: response regulator [Ignavibacteriales bacterium]|nr:response regulator [Ignavibacteriales bacterium]